MKKGIAAAALVAVLALAGCAQTVEGSVETVVKECKEFTTDTDVRVTVTGVVDGDPIVFEDTGNVTVELLDGDYLVGCMFESPSEEDIDKMFGSVTIEGDLMEMVSPTSMVIKNCSIR